MKYTIYTDGSAIKNVSSPTTPAGWGYLVIEGEVGAAHNGGTTIEEDYGKVVTDRSHPLYRGAEVGSNNTAELSAIYWALDWISRSVATEVDLYSDSKYALGVVFGNWKAKKNIELVSKCRQLANLLEMRFVKVEAQHIKAHTGFRWNERADVLAYAAARRTLPE